MKEDPQEPPPTKLSIRDWAKEDRPRERLMKQGPKALSDAELIAILLRSGTPKDSALDLAKSILNRTKNDLGKLAALSTSDLLKFKIKGVGQTKAVTIIAALELGLRRRETVPEERPRITVSIHVDELLRPRIADLRFEEFWIVLMDRGSRLIETLRVSEGGVHGTVADPKRIFKEALDRNASVVVLAHNHPSGQNRPSEEDISLTKKLVEGGRLLDIAVNDHLIITANGYFSFADNGMI